MKTKVLLLAVLMGLAAQGQNLIVNGTDWADSNGDGLADNWQKWLLVTSVSVNGGFQYCYANSGTCSQANINQVLNIANTAPKKYQVTFDVQSCTDVWVLINYNPNIGAMLKVVDFTDSGWASYSVVYDQNFTSNWNIYSLQFCCSNGGENWLMIDNVSMVEILPTGISEPTAKRTAFREGIYDLLVRKLPREPQTGFYIKDGVKHIKYQ